MCMGPTKENIDCLRHYFDVPCLNVFLNQLSKDLLINSLIWTNLDLF